MKKLIVWFMLGAAALGLLSGCGKREEKTVVRLSEVTHSVFYAPLYAALQQGFFEEQGLDIELSNGGGADKVMTAVLAGQAEIGLAGPEASIYVLLEGKADNPVIFAQLTKRDGSFLVGREDTELNWEDLKGSTIVGGRRGGVPEMTLEYVLKKNGLTPGVDVTVDTSIQFDMMAGAFTGGTGDYVTLFEPTATSVEAEGKGYILTSIGQESGEIPYTAFFASGSYINENPEIIAAFTAAIAKGQQWVMSHSSQEVAKAIAGQFPDTDTEVLATVVQRYRDIDAWCQNPVMSKEALERLETVMEEAGELESRVDFDRLVDNSFAEAAANS